MDARHRRGPISEGYGPHWLAAPLRRRSSKPPKVSLQRIEFRYRDRCGLSQNGLRPIVSNLGLFLINWTPCVVARFVAASSCSWSKMEPQVAGNTTVVLCRECERLPDDVGNACACGSRGWVSQAKARPSHKVAPLLPCYRLHGQELLRIESYRVPGPLPCPRRARLPHRPGSSASGLALHLNAGC